MSFNALGTVEAVSRHQTGKGIPFNRVSTQQGDVFFVYDSNAESFRIGDHALFILTTHYIYGKAANARKIIRLIPADTGE